MNCSYSDFRCREVVNICDGCRLGYVRDLEIDTQSGRVLSIIVPGPGRFFGLLGRECDYVIPWPCIRQIGEDIILVEAVLEKVSRPCAKNGKIL